MNTEIKFSRSSASTRSGALEKLRTYNFHIGEPVLVRYGSNSWIFAVGIKEGIGPDCFKVMSIYQNLYAIKVLDSDPGPSSRNGKLWKDSEDHWFLGDQALTTLGKSLICDLENTLIYAVGLDGIPRLLNDVYEREETDNKISSLITQSIQADWTEEDLSSLSYIQNKPQDLTGFIEDIKYEIIEKEPGIYGLYKNQEEQEGDDVIIPPDYSLQAGQIIYISDTPYLDLVLSNSSHIQVSMADFIDTYNPGLGINISEENEVSVKFVAGNGLDINQDNELTINPATPSSSGSMTKEDKEKLDGLDETELTRSEDLINGTIQPKISQYTKGIDAPLSDSREKTIPGFKTIELGDSIKTGEARLIMLEGGNMTPFSPHHLKSSNEDGTETSYLLLNKEAVSYEDLSDYWYSGGNGNLWFSQAYGKININAWGQRNYDPTRKSYYFEYTGAENIKPETTYIFGLQGLEVTDTGTIRYYTTDSSQSTPPTGTVWYELNEKIQTDLGRSATFTAWKNGIERFETEDGNLCETIAKSVTIKYLPNLFSDLLNLQDNLDSKIGWNEIDTIMSGTSENIVQNKVVKEYIDDVVESASSGLYRDVSRRDIYGNILTTMNTANCYVISEPGFYKLPLVYGNAIKNDTPNTESYTKITGTYNTDVFMNYKGNIITSPYIETDTSTMAKTGGIVWQDSEGMIRNVGLTGGNPCKYLTFSVDNVPVLGGNAIICVKDGNGDIMWSWHIWVYADDLKPVEIWNNLTGNETAGTKYEVMPVNLGCVWNGDKTGAMNTYYQWGRKDPMPRSNTYNSTTSVTLYDGTYGTYGTADDEDAGDTVRSIANSIKMPNLFFLEYNATRYNWLAPINDIDSPYNLWDAKGTTGTGDSVTIKTIFDPCPYGWKVPGGSTFKGFTKTQGNTSTASDFNVVGSFHNGWDFWRYYNDPEGLYFPASGLRNRTSGSLALVGSGGFCWSSSSSSQTYGYYLYFNSGYVYPVYTFSRAYGFSVRPLKE